MKISVICPTSRIGGLDVLYAGLSAQTHEDWELIVVDALDGYRKDGFGLPMGWHLLKNTRLAVPEPNRFPVQAFCASANAGLRAATGHVAMFVGDYTYLPANCLARHAAFHEAHPDPSIGVMGPAWNLQHPRVHGGFPDYSKDSPDPLLRYVADLQSGRLDRYGYSIFPEFWSPHDVDNFALCPWLGTADPKTAMVDRALDGGPVPVDRNMLHLKNESFKLQQALDAGGFNEDMDGSVWWQDSEFADALGVYWYLDSKNPAYIVNVRALFPPMRRVRPDGSNEQIWKDGRQGRKWL